MRPVLPRTSSSGSGFFFCGIMLLPVRRVGQLEEAVLLAAEDDEVLGKSAQVHHRHRARVQEGGGEVAIGRGVDAVVDHPRKPIAGEP